MLSVRAYVPTFQNLAKTKQSENIVRYWGDYTVGLTEWIIDDTFLFFFMIATIFFANWSTLHVASLYNILCIKYRYELN